MRKIFLLAAAILIAGTHNYAQKNKPSAALPVLYTDSFDDNTNEWMESNRDSVLKIIKDGKLTIENFSNEYPWSIKYVNLDVDKDFLIALTVKHDAGYINTGYGIVTVKDSGDYYLSFKISADGYYIIGYSDKNGWNMIQDWKQSPHIKKGNDVSNKLVIKHTGKNYEFYANDVLLEKRQSLPFAGQYVGAMSSGRQRVSFDDFELRGYQLKDSTDATVYSSSDYEAKK